MCNNFTHMQATGKVNNKAAFTLIELSIVLVIIGLIVGGVLTGQDLIRAAQIRATITEIEKFNTAVNTFYGRYQGLPGDVVATVAQQTGLSPRDGTPGMGDGNGILEGWDVQSCPGTGASAWDLNMGEREMFWTDLGSIGLVAGKFPYGNCSCATPNGFAANVAQVKLWLPEAKIGGGNYISVIGLNGINYFIISVINGIGTPGAAGSENATSGLSAASAYSIDRKVDDGYPQSGRVIARFVDYGWFWASGNGHLGANTGGIDPPWGGGAQGDPTTAATPATTYTCYDNNNTGGMVEQYSVRTNGGQALNCTLAFRMQ
jgi:prepilin-type N-terminal cleavage/methylation domain-containing protein